ncbi:MAG: two-component system OmpR family sensor kinase [Flavobacteriales bacterium]|jgi:two-component system OmpR family sensor kinase
MNRAFISLYALIVCSILVVGWATEKLWQAYAPDEHSQTQNEVMQVLVAALVGVDRAKSNVGETSSNTYTELLSALTENLNYSTDAFEVLVLGDFASSSIYTKLYAGEFIRIDHDHNQARHYLRIGKSFYVLCFRLNVEEPRNSWFFRLLLFLFYGSIGLLVYLWVLPLTRDLKRLQVEALAFDSKSFDPDSRDATTLKDFTLVGSHSTVYPLARAFFEMKKRIAELISTQQEMTHAISHELRTPLARMKFSLAAMEESQAENIQSEKSLIENTLLDETLLDGVSTGDYSSKILTPLVDIRQDVAEMEGLISEFLHYAKLDSAANQINFQRGDVCELIKALIERNDMQAYSDVNALSENHEVECDWYLMERCLHNVLENAKKYRRNRVLVEVECCDTYCRIAVCDDGDGVSEAEREKVFQAFYRSPSTASGTRGHGLGLALVRRIMHWHHGDIDLGKSTLGGACFELCWRTTTPDD